MTLMPGSGVKESLRACHLNITQLSWLDSSTRVK